MTSGTDLTTLLVIAGLACMTVLTRCFFFILDRPWSLPGWALRALQYAPVAALAGVIAPEIVMQNGQFTGTWQDARLYGSAIGALVYFWRHNVLLTIAAGMAVYLPLHLLLSW